MYQSSNLSTIGTEESNRSNKVVKIFDKLQEICKSETKNENIRKSSISSNASFNFNKKATRQAKSKENYDTGNYFKASVAIKDTKEVKSKANKIKTHNY